MPMAKNKNIYRINLRIENIYNKIKIKPLPVPPLIRGGWRAPVGRQEVSGWGKKIWIIIKKQLRFTKNIKERLK